MGNLVSSQNNAAPQPSGRSVPHESADKYEHVIINDLPDLKNDEFNPMDHLVDLIKMKKYYTAEEQKYFWADRNRRGNEENEDEKVDEDMPMVEIVDDIYLNPYETEDYYQDNVRKLYPKAIKQHYEKEAENLIEIEDLIDSYQSDIESLLGKLEQDVYSPLFVSILSHRNKIFEHITSEYPKYLNQVCGGTDIGACAVMYENRAIFITLASSSWGDKCVASLFMTALDMFWSEARLGSWFDTIRNTIKPEHLNHFRKVSAPEFQRLTTKYPGLMNEIHIMAKQAQQDAKDYGQA